MNKSLCRAHMKRTRFRKNSVLMLNNVITVSLLRKIKKDYYANLNVKDIVGKIE